MAELLQPNRLYHQNIAYNLMNYWHVYNDEICKLLHHRQRNFVSPLTIPPNDSFIRQGITENYIRFDSILDITTPSSLALSDSSCIPYLPAFKAAASRNSPCQKSGFQYSFALRFLPCQPGRSDSSKS